MVNRPWTMSGVFSMVLALGVTAVAFCERATLGILYNHLSERKGGIMILANVLLLYALVLILGLQSLLYGPLSPLESDILFEKLLGTATEMILAALFLKLKIDGSFVVIFVGLLAGKTWSWIGEGRIKAHEQEPLAAMQLSSARFPVALLLSLLFSIYMVFYTIKIMGSSVELAMKRTFSFEFVCLTISSTTTITRYALILIQSYIAENQRRRTLQDRQGKREPAGEREEFQALLGRQYSRLDDTAERINDSVMMLDHDQLDTESPSWYEDCRWYSYLDLIADSTQLTTYLIYLMVSLAFYGPPVHVIRRLFITALNLLRRVKTLLRHLRAIQHINGRSTDATAKELESQDICIICLTHMKSRLPHAASIGPLHRDYQRWMFTKVAAISASEASKPKRLPCGHVLHLGCLRKWFERKPVCPTCRRTVQ
ncbi:hypothetical protein V498_01633 [Pseudogymnoascus sp. VKM F-4517 (FW-2822)]|nr:hypothetical protein V498_01633 [Pseudogymnoascus sp. VKM F-4517 (FW-2822)]